MTLKEKVALATSMVDTNVFMAAQGNLEIRKLLQMTEKDLFKALLLVRANALKVQAETKKKYYI